LSCAGLVPVVSVLWCGGGSCGCLLGRGGGPGSWYDVRGLRAALPEQFGLRVAGSCGVVARLRAVLCRDGGPGRGCWRRGCRGCWGSGSSGCLLGRGGGPGCWCGGRGLRAAYLVQLGLWVAESCGVVARVWAVACRGGGPGRWSRWFLHHRGRSSLCRVGDKAALGAVRRRGSPVVAASGRLAVEWVLCGLCPVAFVVVGVCCLVFARFLPLINRAPSA
jgi:hypothetical protein